ncbi:MAG: hypothetical protein ACRCVX_03530 [Shewanella sp.]
MAELSITDVFGSGATQDATTVTFTKASLAAAGLTASANNTAESILGALVLALRSRLTATGLESNADQSITVIDGFDSLIRGVNAQGAPTVKRQTQINVNLFTPDSFTLDPDAL